MKKIFTALMFLLMPSLLLASNFKEGEHYKIVAEQKSNTQELREYFSYYCPTCRAYEPYLGKFKQALPSNAKFKKVHVDFMGYSTAEIQFLLTKAHIIAEKAKIIDKFASNTYQYLQTDRKKINSQADIRQLFVKSGGDGAMFDKGMKNFSIVSQAKAYKKVQDKLSKARHLTSVPTMVVNGKYLINSRALDKNNFFEEYTALVSYLFTLP